MNPGKICERIAKITSQGANALRNICKEVIKQRKNTHEMTYHLLGVVRGSSNFTSLVTQFL